MLPEGPRTSNLGGLCFLMFEKCMHDRKPEQATSKLEHGVIKTVMLSLPNEETSNCSWTEHFPGKQMQTLDALGTQTVSVVVTWRYALFKTLLAICILFIINYNLMKNHFHSLSLLVTLNTTMFFFNVIFMLFVCLFVCLLLGLCFLQIDCEPEFCMSESSTRRRQTDFAKSEQGQVVIDVLPDINYNLSL